jgi:hypothetical protein
MADGMDLSLQKACVEVLMGDTELMAMIGSRLHQDVPENPTYPYVQIGNSQEIDDSTGDCQTASEIFLDIHVWTREPQYVAVKRIGNRIRKLLHDREPILDENRCVILQHRITRNMEDAEVIIKHAVVTFDARTEDTT